ncbi:phage tail tape measure protein [Mycobacterium europaeum]|uniref:phage tail tape measure protein n=1 Tax=Mycobacterium europaeum TaxID=761804 RepID=UPI001FCC28D9|nr:phage tail tape measure protein [Mycobacterium europaeum]
MYLDVVSRLDERAMMAASRRLVDEFAQVGNDISHGLRSSLSKAFGALDGSGARQEFLRLEQAARRAADVQEDAARREVRALGLVEVAQRRLNEVTDKYGADSSRAAAANVALADSNARAAKAQRDHVAAMADGTAAHTALTNAVGGSTAAIGRFHKAATIASAGVVGGFVAAAVDATKAAGDFQVQLVRLETVGGELPKNLKTIHDGLMSLASATGWNPTELATGMLKVEQAGYRSAEALTVMKAAAQGAAEEGIGLDEAANAVTTTLGDYHLGADQAANVTSKMIEAVRLSKTTFAEFTGALHNVEPTAAAVGESLNDLLATLGMLTRSGMHADQASDNLNHALSSLGNIQPKQREMLAAIGLDPREIPQNIRSKGYIGTAQEIRSAVDRRLGPNGNVILDAFENNPASQALEHEQYGKLSPSEKAVADRIMQGQLSQKEFRKSRGGLGVTEARIVDQWLNTHENNQGFNRVLKSLNTDQLGVMQALQTAVGGQDNARTMLQVTDQNNPDAVKHRQEIADAHADPNGDVMEYKRSQQNFNAQWKDLKASVDALKIEFGEDFLPTATKWVKSLETGVHWMQQHRQLVKDLIEDVTVLSSLFLGMKLATGLVNTVKEFRNAVGRTTVAVDQTNTSLRASGAAAQAGALDVTRAATQEQSAQQRVKDAVYQSNQELRQAGAAARAGSTGVMDAATEDVGAQNRVKTAAAEANAQLRGAGAAAEAGAAGVAAAANTEVSAMGRVISAAGRAKSALAAVGGMAASVGGDMLQANTRENTNPHKLGVIASDAGNMALAGGAIASVIPGIGTGIGAAIGGIGGAAYGIWDQYFSGDHDVAAPDNPTPDNGPVPVVPQPDVTPPTSDLTAPVPGMSQPEAPDTPYAGGGGGGGNGKKHKDTDPLDEDLQRIERLQTEANEIQARLADDRASNDPVRRGEIPWLQKKLDEINRELAGINGKGKGGSGAQEPWMPVKLDDNWLQGGLPGLARNAVGFLEDLVLGPLEVAAFRGVPDFDGAGGKAGRHSRHGKHGRHSPDGLGAIAEGPGGPLGAIPGASGAGSGVVPVFVTNWASGAPGAPGGPGAAGTGSGLGIGGFGGGAGSGAGSFPGSSSGSFGFGAPPTPDLGAAAGTPGGSGGVPIYQAADGSWHSSNPAWEHLIQRESSGRNITQEITDSNSGGNEAFGIFQITPDTWKRYGGQGSVYDSTPEQQAIIAARILQGNPSGSDWGAGMAGRESAQALLAGLTPERPTGPKRPDGVAAHNFYKDWYPVNTAPGPAPAAPSDGLGDLNADQKRALLRQAFTRPPIRPGEAAPDSPPLPPVNPRTGRRFGDMDTRHSAQPTPQRPREDQGFWSSNSGGTGHLNVPKVMDYLNPVYWSTGGLSDGFPGGPKGTDTIPAWLSPGEMVMNARATSQFLPQLKSMNAQYFDDGTGAPLNPTQPTPPAQPQNMVKSPGAPGAPGGPPGAPKPGQPAGPKPSGGGATSINDKGVSALTTPGADAQQPGTGQPSQPGIGFSGGLIGGLEGAATSAAAMGADMGSFGAAGGAVSSVMNVGFQELNRAAAAGAQDAGIGVEALLEALIPDAGGSSSDWSKTIPGRLLMGITGVRPAASQNTAGQTQQPFASNASDDKYANGGGGGNTQAGSPIQILGPVHVQANNTSQLHSELNQQTSMAANRMGTSPRGTW